MAQVKCSHSARMHVTKISSDGRVSFVRCLQGCAPWPDEPVSAPFVLSNSPIKTQSAIEDRAQMKVFPKHDGLWECLQG